MKFADKYLPPLPDGNYTVTVTQAIETTSPDQQHPEKSITEKDNFITAQEFSVLSRGFTLLPDEVFSVYPAENARGDFERELPFLVSPAKTLPWLYGSGDIPWVALIAINERDGEVAEQDITIAQLLAGAPDRTYVPGTGMPEKYVEEGDEECHIIDIPKALYREIMPLAAERALLCHARYSDLSDTEESVSQMDGYFSVVIGNRLLPAGRNTIHLISVLGYPDYDSSEYAGYDRIRVVSLYHWSAYCEPEYNEDFSSVVKQLTTGMLSGDGTHELSKRGICAKAHYTRSGDLTGSLYHSPLCSYRPEVIPQLITPCYSADSVLIYDPDAGVFDVTYAAAWQLGRMTALAKETVPRAVVSHRTGVLKQGLKAQIGMTAGRMMPDYKEVCRQLTEVLIRKEPE